MVKKRRLRERRRAVVAKVLDAIFGHSLSLNEDTQKEQENRFVVLLEGERGMCEL